MAVSRNGPASEGTLADVLAALGGGIASPTGATGATAPVDATLVGGADATGKLQGLATGRVTPTATLAEFLNALVWAVFNTTPTTRTNGQGGPLEADASGNLLNSLGTRIAGENIAADVLKVETNYTATNITTGGNTIKSGAGFIEGLTLGLVIATGTITIADATSGTTPTILVITFGATVVDAPGQYVPINVPFTTGMTITLSAGTWNVLVRWR